MLRPLKVITASKISLNNKYAEIPIPFKLRCCACVRGVGVGGDPSLDCCWLLFVLVVFVVACCSCLLFLLVAFAVVCCFFNGRNLIVRTQDELGHSHNCHCRRMASRRDFYKGSHEVFISVAPEPLGVQFGVWHLPFCQVCEQM